MKTRFLILLTFLTVVFTLHAQTKPDAYSRLQQELASMEKAYMETYQQPKHAQAIELMQAMLVKIDQAANKMHEMKERKEMINNMKSNLYYNMACSYALLGKKHKAINAFLSAVDYGYKNYQHALTDTDLDNLRNDQRFKNAIASLEQYDYRFILRHAAKYSKETADGKPTFVYQQPDDYYLQRVKEYFKLDSVAGKGDEISKIISLMQFVHNSIRHDGERFALCETDAIDIYNYHKATGNGVNCRQLAIALNGLYLAMGFPSRYVTCLPKDPNDYDCHVINCVYSSQLGKWVWMDPTFNAYVKDDNGNFLSIAEVRERIINMQPLVLNNDANWNNESPMGKAEYLDSYMAKNLYWLECAENSCFNPETRFRQNEQRYIQLVPEGFSVPLNQGVRTVTTSDPDYFWQTPSTGK